MKRENDLRKSWKEQYAKIASQGDSCCPGDTCRADPIERAKADGYSAEEIRSVPQEAVMGMGCGNPTALAELEKGETVLDLGCGGGLDVFLAAQRVGEKGKVIGVDMTPEMVERARENAIRGDYKNVEFRLAEIEKLPVEDGCIDVIISNCVINHSPDKLATFKEVYRCLKPKGRILIADLVIEGELPEDIVRSVDKLWGEWIAGALGKQEYLNAIKGAGFEHITIPVERPFDMPGMDDRLKGKIISIQVKAHKKGGKNEF